ncbi:MAG: hypothetical protein ABIR33_05290 [Pyrinomonadaceae bacterium]
MNRISKLIGVGAFALMFLGLPSMASAQYYPGGNGGYGNGGYGNNRNNRDLRGTIQNLKNRARQFETATNRVEDRRDDRDDRRDNRNGGWGNNRNAGWGNNRGGGDYGRLEDLADNFRKATDRLENSYGNGRNLNGSRDEARRVLDIGNQIENELRRLRGGQNLERQWSQIRYDLNAISNVYGGNYGNGGGYNNNRYPNGNNGDWRNRIPFPLPF